MALAALRIEDGGLATAAEAVPRFGMQIKPLSATERKTRLGRAGYQGLRSGVWVMRMILAITN